MEPFVKHIGIVSPLDRMNVDTDAIIPKQFLKRIERTGFGAYLFYELRYDESGKTISDFSLNKARYKDTSILLSRANFGCGSSREHAPWALADYGFKAIIAPSYADIFYNNCFNNGILPIVLDTETVDMLFKRCEDQVGYTLEIDLETCTLKDDYGLSTTFQVDDSRRNKLLNGLDDISLTLSYLSEIEAYESKHSV